MEPWPFGEELTTGPSLQPHNVYVWKKKVYVSYSIQAEKREGEEEEKEEQKEEGEGEEVLVEGRRGSWERRRLFSTLG